jgi:Divergent InlB B-repeat domain
MRRSAVLAAGVVAALGGAWVAVNSLATTTGPIEWTAPSPIVPASLIAEGSTSYTPAALSCRGASLCVAVTEGGDVLASGAPALVGETWNVKLVDPSHGLTAIACPSTSLCVATDSAGEVLTSQDPTAETPTWSTSTIDNSTRITALACPSTELCVAADAAGRILVSEEPAGGSDAWRASLIDAANAPIDGLACASSSMCVAVDNFGDVLTSEEPAGGPSAWSIARVDGQHPLDGGVTCPSELFCATTDNAGNLLVSTNPMGGASTWNVAPNPEGQHLGLISCSTTTLCVATESEGRIAVTSEPTAASPNWTAAPVDGAGGLLTALTCNTQLTCISLDISDNAIIGGGLSPTEPLGVSLTGSGYGTVLAQGISCPPSCGASYTTGSQVVLTATPAAGSSFAGWTGDCSGFGQCTVLMDAPRALTATFTAANVGPRVILAVTLGGLGRGRVSGPGIACPPTCSATVAPKAIVPLNATASSGSSFTGWGGAALACERRSSCSITMASTEEVKATFTRRRPSLLTITKLTVQRARHAAWIEFTARPPVARVVCVLTRLEGSRRRRVHLYQHCRTPVIYRHLIPATYVVTLEAFRRNASFATVTINHRFAL